MLGSVSPLILVSSNWKESPQVLLRALCPVVRPQGGGDGTHWEGHISMRLLSQTQNRASGASAECIGICGQKGRKGREGKEEGKRRLRAGV